MHTIIKRALWGVLIGGGISLLGAGVAQAADTSGEDGLLSGTQAILDVEAPVTVAGNAISVLGDSHSDDADTQAPAAAPAPAPAASTSGDDGAAAGAQASAYLAGDDAMKGIVTLDMGGTSCDIAACLLYGSVNTQFLSSTARENRYGDLSRQYTPLMRACSRCARSAGGATTRATAS